MALIRTAVLAGLIYAGFVVAYPDGHGALYHEFVPFLIAGGVVGLAFFKKILDLGEGALKFGLELAFLAAVAVLVGYTMPQKSGKAPLTQWAEGARPTRADARRGLKRLSVDPDGSTGKFVLKLFPN
ncbi:MAG: hypothetical protein HKL90_13930 [Elusimicrobia bacterium]|nr:hypothetical protein [Elusimicrobiota bacterium]